MLLRVGPSFPPDRHAARFLCAAGRRIRPEFNSFPPPQGIKWTLDVHSCPRRFMVETFWRLIMTWPGEACSKMPSLTLTDLLTPLDVLRREIHIESNQEIPQLLWNSKVSLLCTQEPPLTPTIDHPTSSYPIIMNYINIIISSTHHSPEWLLSFKFLYKNSAHIYNLSRFAC